MRAAIIRLLIISGLIILFGFAATLMVDAARKQPKQLPGTTDQK
jgi:hypothetical protein